MNKLLLISTLIVLGATAPLAANAQEISCNPACGTGYTCNTLSGVCEQTAAAQASTPPNTGSTGFVPLAPIPGLTDSSITSVVNSTSLANFFNNLYKYLIGLAAILAIIEIIWGGLEYATQDSISKKSDGKQRIYSAILGLVLILSPVLVFSIINPSILNLSIGLPPLDTVSMPSVSDSATQAATPPPIDTAIKQSNGAQTIPGVSFTITSIDTKTLPEIRNLLNSKQADCKKQSNGLGFINPPTPGTNVYTCQTCPTGTTLRLQTARDAATPLGVCNVN